MSFYGNPIPDSMRPYIKMDYYWRHHRIRYERYVEANGYTCQACCGRGHYDMGWEEPPEPCGYCEQTGRVTRWMRGWYLTWKRQERAQKC